MNPCKITLAHKFVLKQIKKIEINVLKCTIRTFLLYSVSSKCAAKPLKSCSLINLKILCLFLLQLTSRRILKKLENTFSSAYLHDFSWPMKTQQFVLTSMNRLLLGSTIELTQTFFFYLNGRSSWSFWSYSYIMTCKENPMQSS